MEIVRFFLGGGGGGICLTLTGFCQQIKGELFAFWHFSVTYNVSFTKIICIGLPHRLKVFSCIFHGIQFSCIKKKYLTSS